MTGSEVDLLAVQEAARLRALVDEVKAAEDAAVSRLQEVSALSLATERGLKLDLELATKQVAELQARQDLSEQTKDGDDERAKELEAALLAAQTALPSRLNSQ